MHEPTPMYERIIAVLQANGVEYEAYEHEHVHHSHEAAKVRGTKVEEAAKAIVLETGSHRVVQCIISGHRRIDLKKLKSLLGEKDVHLAAPERVLEATGCTVGSVPPFGNLFAPPMPVYADLDVFSRDHVVFSAGSHHHSVRMLARDWEKVVNPTVADIGKDDGQNNGANGAAS